MKGKGQSKRFVFYWQRDRNTVVSFSTISFIFAVFLVTKTFCFFLLCRLNWSTSPRFLLPLPGLRLTSHWPWPTIVFCWNQLAATPGTRIIPVSLFALVDWSPRAKSFHSRLIAPPQNCTGFPSQASWNVLLLTTRFSGEQTLSCSAVFDWLFRW